MSTTNQAALSKAHHYLSDDLAKLAQLLQPQNEQADVLLYRAQRRLESIQELAMIAPELAGNDAASSPNGTERQSDPLMPRHLRPAINVHDDLSTKISRIKAVADCLSAAGADDPPNLAYPTIAQVAEVIHDYTEECEELLADWLREARHGGAA